jgi:anti-sigma B factor antagonist
MNPIAHSAVGYEVRHWDPGFTRPHVITASGELDLQAAPDLRDVLCRLVELGTRHCVVDLTDATFVDSTALGVLTGRVAHLRAEGGSLALVCSNESILRTIEIAGLDRAFRVYPTLAEALAHERSE